MFNLKLKRIIDFLFIFGIGFATSCVVSLNGFRENIEIAQLLIGGILIVISIVLYFIFYRCPNCKKLLNPFDDKVKVNEKCKKCK